MTETFPRSRFEIINQILVLCSTPTQKTNISRECNLSEDQLKTYLDFLVSTNLLGSFLKNDTELYQTTEHGKTFIEEYERLKSSLKISGPQPKLSNVQSFGRQNAKRGY